MHLKQTDLLVVESELCKRSLTQFVRRAWHVLEPDTTLQWGWMLDAICQHLEAITAGKIKRLLINVPPGCMKSLLVGVFWPAWEWGPQGRPGLRYLGAAYKQDLAIRDNLRCRRLIQSDWFQRLWPIKLVGDQNAKTKFENSVTGFREAMAFISMTGSRGDRIILDDPLSVEGGYSSADLRTAECTFTEVLPTRINNDDSAIVVIMQRLHVDDTSGIILSRDLGYVHLCLPMRFEAERRCITRIGFKDPRSYDGELLFPGRFSEVTVNGLERIMGSHATAGQLQQRPVARGGNLIRGDWFQLYDIPPRLKYRVIYADTAQKTAEHNDYSVFEEWGLGEDGRVYLLDMIRGKWEVPELERRAPIFWNKAKSRDSNMAGQLRQLKIEDTASGTGLIQRMKLDHRIPVVGIKRIKDRYTRLTDVLGYIESGYVCLPRNASFLSDFIAECEAFTADNSHPHDDQIDSMVDAIADMLAGGKMVQLREISRRPRETATMMRGY